MKIQATQVMIILSETFTNCFIAALVSCDTCDGVTCHNGGTCEAGSVDFWCERSKGWTGRNCYLNGMVGILKKGILL